ncbi:MAG: hypothetical protein AAGH15_25075 [Myxococcota bacterium]
MAFPEPGLYRTTVAHPKAADAIPADRLVYVGKRGEDGAFVVVPHYNEHNRWFWREPTTDVDDASWGESLVALPAEGFYTLPRTLTFEGGGRWLENAVVQLGYDRAGQGIVFVAERRPVDTNALFFSDRGQRIDDALLFALRWAPILPVRDAPGTATH